MSASFEPRAMCPRCGRPESVCLCAHVRPITTRTRVVILQHPRESGVPIGTARLAALALPRVERHVGVEFSASPAVAAALSDPAAPAILLFPGPAAQDLSEAPPEHPVTLIVIDGTWWQAEKILKQNPELSRLPRYKLTPGAPSRYRIRRAPAHDCISTIEAIVAALGVLEGGDSELGAALAPFDALVEQQLAFAEERGERRHLSRPRRAPRVPALLRERAGDLVAGYGEANAWPRGHALGARPELVHWAAERVVSGERFEAFIAPANPLSPAFQSHTGIAAARVLGGEPWSSFLERWRAFLRPSDLLGTWGFYASELLRRAGGLELERLDLRTVAIDLLRKKPGDVRECAAALDVAPLAPWVAGRTGARLSGLVAVARGLIARAA